MEAIDVVRINYVKELLAKKTREDSRGMMEMRPITVERSPIEHAEGSSQVDLGATKVMCGIKLSVEEPMKDTPDMGNLSVAAELLPLASAEYESGPPSPDAIEFARVVDRGIRAAECVNLSELFIEEGKVWSIFMDLYVLNYNGNLFDAGSMAAMSALLNARMPKYEDGKIIWTDRTKKLKVNNVITSTTFAKIGGTLLIDPTKNEEDAADARLTVANDGTYIRAMQKGLSGGFSVKEIEELVEESFKKHKELKSYITND
jgi:exosome complex component RRP42